MAEKKYLDLNGLNDVASYVNTRLKTVTTMPVSADNGAVRLYVGVTDSNYTQGHIYQYSSTSSEWVDITPTADVSNKADKVTSATNGDLASLNSSGNLTDSGILATNVLVKSATSGLVKNDGTIDTKSYATTSALSNKADKVSSPTDGDVAGLDSNGNLTDSGILAINIVQKSNTSGLLKNDGTVDTNIYLTSSDVVDKADKVDNAISGDFAGLDSSGNLIDSGKKPSDFIEKSNTEGLVKNDGTIDTNTYLTASDVSGKADKVSGATNGDFAGLDANGNLTDSGKKPSDFIEKSNTAGLVKNDGSIDTNTYLTASDVSDFIEKSSTVGLVKNDGSIDTNTYLTASDISDKVDKVSSATNGDLASLDSNGNLVDSGILGTDVIQKSNTAGLIKNDGTIDTTSYATTASLGDKADKVTSATADDFATLDNNGNLTDSGINKAIVPSGASSSNKLATANDIPTELNDLSDDVVITSPVNKQILAYNSTSGKWENQTGQAAIGGAVFKGSILFTDLPTTGMLNGDWYDIKDAFTTDNRFEEGAGIDCAAGTDVIWVDDDSKWNILTPSGVFSFNGRTGAVSPASGDYTASDVGLGNVVNTGDSATPVSGGTTKFTTGGAYTELAKKADKVSSATEGNFAGLDANGNLTDSGSKASDFSTVKSRQTPASGGTALSLVNTGDMYTWNNKANTSTAYLTSDTAETTLADDDKFPFYDTSATAKKNSTWSNIKAKLKSYFDGIYSTFSGSYNDLTNKPTIPAAQVNSDWDATSGVAEILNKPTIPSVANCYQSTDTAETTFANDDKIPFYDTSASAKRNSTWSNIKSVLKTYFDTLYTNNTGTVTSVGTGAGLTGGTITGSGTIKANLKSETASTLASSAMGSTSSRQYAVGIDKDNYLSVNIPWTDTITKSASSDTSSKIFLIGATSQSSSGVTTYSDNEVYTTSGVLTSRKLTTKAITAMTGSGTAGSDAGSGTSPRYTPTLWTFDSSITVEEGEVYFIKIPEAGGTYGVWLSLDNGTNYYPVAVSNGKGRFTTQYLKNTVIAVAYESTSVCSCYARTGADALADVTGCFRVFESYDSNTTYSSMTQAEANTGTSTTARLITPKVLTDTIKNKVTVANSGTASTTAVSRQTITVAGTATDINGSVYMEGTATLSTSATTTFTFTNSTYITTSKDIDVHCSIFGLVPQSVSISSNTCTVVFPKYTSAASLTCRIYIR